MFQTLTSIHTCTHYALTGTDTKSIRLLATQPVDLSRPHPFIEAGNKEFNCFLWMPPGGDRAGDILLADSTIFTTLFGGDKSLEMLLEESSNQLTQRGRNIGRRLLAVACILFATATHAQNRGVYPLGMSALNSGVTPAPGFTYTNQFLYYSRDEATDDHGNTLPVTGQNYVAMDMNSLVWVTSNKPILGARYLRDGPHFPSRRTISPAMCRETSAEALVSQTPTTCR